MLTRSVFEKVLTIPTTAMRVTSRVAGGLVDLLLDRFNTNQAAPLGSTRTCEPGPGTWMIVDTENKISVTSQALRFSGGKATPAYGDPTAWTMPFARMPGRAYFATFTITTSPDTRLGWTNLRSGPITPYYSWFFTGNIASPATVGVYANGTTYQLAIILRGSLGAIYALSGGAFTGGYNILYVDTTAAAGTLYGGIGVNDATISVDDVTVRDLGGAWETDLLYSVATNRVASPTSGTTTSSTANAFLEFAWTPASSETLELSFRRTDDNNRLILRCSQTAGTIRLYEKNAGVETERTGGATAQTWTAGTAYRITMRASGSGIRAWVNDSGKNLVTGITFNQSATGVKVEGFATGSNLVCWPLILDLTQSASSYPPQRQFLVYGDSKSAGTGDTTPPANGLNGYPRDLCQLINGVEVPARIAVGGRSTSAAKAAVDTELAATVGTPDYILYNLGANDNAFDATWQTNTAYILDAMHVKWPSAYIYCMRVWTRTGGSSAASAMATALNTVLASRSAWAHVGPNEAVFLENGDNGVTYTGDGVHPNRAGYALTAQQWKTAMGL